MTSASTPIADEEGLAALSAVTSQHQQQKQEQPSSSTVTTESASSVVGHNGTLVVAQQQGNYGASIGQMRNTGQMRESWQMRDSCDSCANSKVKCTGGSICSRCQTKGIACIFSPRRKRGPAGTGKRATRDTALETLSSAAVAAGAAKNGGAGEGDSTSASSSSTKRPRTGSVSENTNGSGGTNRKHKGDSSSGTPSKQTPTAATSMTSGSELAVLVQLQREQLALCRQQTADNQRFQAQLMTMLAVLVGQRAPGSGYDSTVDPVPQNIADRT